MEKKCQNCGKLLEDSFLTHCSMNCRFEDYLNSQSANQIAIEASESQSV